jgi:hypothetical protein
VTLLPPEDPPLRVWRGSGTLPFVPHAVHIIRGPGPSARVFFCLLENGYRTIRPFEHVAFLVMIPWHRIDWVRRGPAPEGSLGCGGSRARPLAALARLGSSTWNIGRPHEGGSELRGRWVLLMDHHDGEFHVERFEIGKLKGLLPR